MLRPPQHFVRVFLDIFLYQFYSFWRYCGSRVDLESRAPDHQTIRPPDHQTTRPPDHCFPQKWFFSPSKHHVLFYILRICYKDSLEAILVKGFSGRKALGNVRLSCVGALFLTNENAVLMPIQKLILALSVICFAITYLVDSNLSV